MVNDMKLTQKERTLKYLQTHAYVTAYDGFEKLGITQMHTVIHNLREDGYDIRKTMIKNKNTGTYYARWSLKNGK